MAPKTPEDNSDVLLVQYGLMPAFCIYLCSGQCSGTKCIGHADVVLMNHLKDLVSTVNIGDIVRAYSQSSSVTVVFAGGGQVSDDLR